MTVWGPCDKWSPLNIDLCFFPKRGRERERERKFLATAPLQLVTESAVQHDTVG